MILLIDNYDSFSYNLYQLVGTINPEIKVIRNDELTVSQIEQQKPTHILLSPGPGYPRNAGVCIETAAKLGKKIPLLGVCLGHQAICEAFGASISHAKQLMHGKQSEILLEETCPIFKGLPKQIRVARYHSLAARGETIPEGLVVTATTADNEVMAVMHRQYPIYGVQFHPESILTPNGMKMIQNFLAIKEEGAVNYVD
jgi:anthranilate synthase component 2